MRQLSIIVFLSVCFANAFNDSLIVASVGTYTITAEDLMTSFEFGPAFVRRSQNPLKEHLQYMIYERLLALEAQRNGLDASEFVRERVRALEEDGAVEQLYRNDILSQVKLSEEQIAQDIQKAKITVSLRWIFAPTHQDAERLRLALTKGASFDSLFSLQFDSTMGTDSRSLETTMLKLERDNHDLARSLSTVKTGECSQPIQGKDGWYIVRVDQAWQNPITTETDYANLKNQSIEIRTKIIADELADAYVKNIMKQHHPVIKADGFNILRAYIADKGLSRDTKVKWEIPSTFMTEAGPQPIQNSGLYLNSILVTFGNRSMTIRDYIRWYDIRQFQFDTRSLQAFNSSVKKTIWKMVQDKLLSEEAYRRGFDRDPTVAHETEKWKVKLLYLAQRSALMRTINLSDSAVKTYFTKNEKQYRTSRKQTPVFSQIKDEVRNDYYREQEKRTLRHALDYLKQTYPISVNENMVQQLANTIQPDPRAIEMIFYKPGGTFPRVAFPTIDEAWQSMK